MFVCSELLVSEGLGLNLGESSDGLIELVISVEGPLLYLLPLTSLLELIHLLNVVVLGKVHGAGGKDSITACLKS